MVTARCSQERPNCPPGSSPGSQPMRSPRSAGQVGGEDKLFPGSDYAASCRISVEPISPRLTRQLRAGPGLRLGSLDGADPQSEPSRECEPSGSGGRRSSPSQTVQGRAGGDKSGDSAAACCPIFGSAKFGDRGIANFPWVTGHTGWETPMASWITLLASQVTHLSDYGSDKPLQEHRLIDIFRLSAPPPLPEAKILDGTGVTAFRRNPPGICSGIVQLGCR